MTNPSIKKIGALLESDNADLQSLYSKIQILQELNTAVISYLDSSMKSTCSVANKIGDKLVIIVANGSIATQLRLIAPELIKKFKTNPLLKDIREIHCKVRPPLARSQRITAELKHTKVSPLSSDTAEMIREMAETLDDQKLREIMLKIAKHTEKESK